MENTHYPVPDAPPPPLGECLPHWARRYGDHTALVDGEQRLSFAGLDHRVERLAAGLHRLGLRRGDRAMLQLPNSIGFVSVCLALFRLGVIPVLAMPTQRSREIEALCHLAAPTAYFIPATAHGFDYRPLAASIAATRPALQVIVDGDPGEGPSSFRALGDVDGEPARWPAPTPDEVAVLLLSGGTTGTPKLIPRTHADYFYNFTASAALCALGSDSVYLAVLPAAHNFTLACPGVFGTLASGGTVVLSATASCDVAMPLIARERVTHLALVPPLAQLWAQAREWETSDLSSLRVLQVGGSRLAPALARQLSGLSGARLQQVFGMAEGLLCFTRLDDPLNTILHTQGRPLSSRDRLRIVDGQGREVADGSVGELQTRGPYTIRHYYRAPEQDALSFTADGFYRTGDLVRRDGDGNLIVEGRLKEQIHRSGEKIAIADIESQLCALPGVQAAIVVAVPDPLLGERICAFVQPAGEAMPDGLALNQALSARGLGQFMLPDQIETLPAWPLTPVGKIDRRRLVALATAADRAPPLRRYAEQQIRVNSAPLELAARLAGKLPTRHYTLYECRGEWSIGMDAALSLVVDARGTVHHSNGTSREGSRPCAGIAEALADIPFTDWRAYGRATFEFAHLAYGIHVASDGEPLLRLSIPQSEIRLRDGLALIRSLDPAALPGLAALVVAGDIPSRPPLGKAIGVLENREAEARFKQQVSAAVGEMQAGDYQKVILSRAVEVPSSLDMVSSYLAGRRANTPARSFLLRDGDFQAYGFSPETVVEVDARGQVSTQPLAGTRALAGETGEDARLQGELLGDAKEIAEHAVSVKLAMSEMSAFCDTDSLGVSEFMDVCRRGSVQHLASRVRGQLATGCHAWDAFEKLFPAVTASGIPKREALDSIRRHEAQPRGLYSGCVMIVDSDGALDAALVLRSVYRDGDRCWLQAGAGLVPLSTPEREWTETCEKLACVAQHLHTAAV